MKTVLNMDPDKLRPMRQTGKSRLALVVLSIYWVSIFILSHIPRDYVPSGWTVSGKTHHLVAYFVLTLLVFINAGLIRKTSLRSKKTWLMIGVVIAYGALDEFLQTFIQGRHGSHLDWAVDVVGCLLCVGLLWLAQRLCYRVWPQGR